MLLHDIYPGWTWQRLMKENIENEKQRKAAEEQIKKENAKAFEMLYNEMFK